MRLKGEKNDVNVYRSVLKFYVNKGVDNKYVISKRDYLAVF